MRINEVEEGVWRLANDGCEQFFGTQREALVMSRKLSYAQTVQALATRLASDIDVAADLFSVYWDRGYGSGETAITDEDVASLGITAADITAMITVMEQLGNFASGADVTSADYDATINKIRTDA